MFTDKTHLPETVRSLRSGREIPITHAERCCDRTTAVEDEIHALVPEEDRWQRLQKQAHECETDASNMIDKPPLYGVPVGIKDIFHVDGIATNAGSDLPSEVLAGPESVAWKRLRTAGAVPFAKTVTTEFAYFEPGPTRNPHDTHRTPGGSSSGSAAAVAAGFCPLALGTQTIGSIVRPAAFCGVIGFKPTYNRVPTEGVLPLAPSLDHVGLFTQNIEGLALAASVVCDDWAVLPDPVDRPTLGVPADAYLDQADETGRTHFEHHLSDLAAAGYEVVRTDILNDIDTVNDQHNRLMAAEAALCHRKNGWYPDYRDRYAESTLELIEEGESVPTAEVATGRMARITLRAEIESAMADNGIDMWVSPAATGPAPEGIESTGDPAMNLPWTNTGMPALTLPVARTDAGLPLGLQCVSATDADESLLIWAALIAEDLGTIVD
ncbi:MAG TPA: amidase [Halococcus sp.]|nr:amidase [Halococcus sp.]